VSVAVSQSVTRKSASNLALAFCLLPADRRRAMCALYAFCRAVDDVADEDSRPANERRQQLAEWRDDLRRACAGETPTHPIARELQPFIARFGLPFDEFDELVRGCEMDLDRSRYADWPELEQYCYRVACVVGLLSLRIFGCDPVRGRDYAIALGHALQLTNILRDIGSDARRGRIYVPVAELAQHGVSAESLLAHQRTPGFGALAGAVAARARRRFQEARTALPADQRRAVIAAELMGAVYWRLLRQIERGGYAVLEGPPARVSKPVKLALIARTWWRVKTGSAQPNYGAP
jgi:phytoene synthase